MLSARASAARADDCSSSALNGEPRALVRAELLERGYEVRAVETWQEAELLLRTRGFVPDGVLFDVAAEREAERALETLAGFVPATRVLVLTSVNALSPQQIALRGFPRAVSRPLQIKILLRAMASMLGDPAV